MAATMDGEATSSEEVWSSGRQQMSGDPRSWLRDGV
jgi:hypothetical protein